MSRDASDLESYMEKSLKQRIKDQARELIDQGEIQGILGLRRIGAHIHPYLFKRSEEIGDLSLGNMGSSGDARYPLVKTLTRLACYCPADRFAIVVRGCEERAIDKLFLSSILDRKRVVMLGFPCAEELAVRHRCLKPYPDALAAGIKPAEAVSPSELAPVTNNIIRDFGVLKESAERCMKCYGCRNVCPVCFCRECTLADALFIPKGDIAPTNPDFFITRAVHMAGYCVYCGLCEEACPADIPLMTIYRMIADIIGEQGGPIFQGVPSRGNAPGAREMPARKAAV